MKWYKKLLVGILAFILIDLIGLLAISFNLKNILVNGIIKETIIEQLTPREYKDAKYVIPEEEINKITDNEEVREILNSKEVQELLNKYLDMTVNSLIDEESIDEINLEHDMLEFLKENKDVLEQKVGKEITDEMIDNAEEQFEGKDMTKAFKQTLKNTKQNMSETEVTFLKGYSLLISTKFKVLLFILMIIDLLLIAIIQKSLYKWIKTLGKCLLIGGIGIILISIIVSKIVSTLSEINSFNTNSLLYSGIGITIGGIIILII